jgi:LPS sulfotransferase NodH
MLDGIDTGYEGKFDFRTAPPNPTRTYLLASVPRAGSTHFSHLLWKTGCLGAPLEYLNFDPAGPYGFAASSTELQLQLWRSVLRRRSSPNGVFGLKAFVMQFDQLNRANPPLLQDVLAAVLPRDAPRNIVYLRRRDRVAQVVSYARATLSGIWRKEQERGQHPSLEYSQEALDACERGILFQEHAWEKMFNDLRIDPLPMWHEDVLADPQAAAGAVARYLGVTLDEAAAVAIPEIHKQSEHDTSEWRARLTAARGSASGDEEP